MNTHDFLFHGALPLLFYSGPFVPLLAALLFSFLSHTHVRRNSVALAILTGTQALFFVPFLIALASDPTCASENTMGLMIFPCVPGTFFFVSASVYAMIECSYLGWLLIPRRRA